MNDNETENPETSVQRERRASTLHVRQTDMSPSAEHTAGKPLLELVSWTRADDRSRKLVEWFSRRPESDGGRAARAWVESDNVPREAERLCHRIADQVLIYWVITGAPAISQHEHFEWLRCSSLSSTPVAELKQKFDLITQFACFCKTLPAGFSPFADVMKAFEPSQHSANPRPDDQDFDAWFVSMATNYSKLPKTEKRRP
jgi:hypothetical protein